MKFSMHMCAWLLFSVLQCTWLEKIAVIGVKPELLFVYVAVVCFFCPRTEGMILGGLFGLTVDILLGRALGVNAVLYLLTAYFITTFCENVLRGGNAALAAAVTAVMTFLSSSVYYLFAFSFIGEMSYGVMVKDILWIMCLYNGVIAAVLFVPIRRMAKKLYSDREF